MLVQNNTPSQGYIQWSDVKITYKGVTHSITNGNTNFIYIYWKYADPDGFYGSNVYPTLGADDLLVFLNKNGTHLKVPNTTILDGSLIVPESILTDALAANSVTAEKILAGTISAAQIAAGAIGTNQLAADSVISSKILAGTIVSADIASRTIQADRLVAGTITANEIASRTIIANDIATGTLTANEIAAGTITGDKLVINAITAREIAVGAITTNHIAAAGISADVIKGGTISGVTISGGTINTTGTNGQIILSGDTLESRYVSWSAKLSAGELSVGSFAKTAILSQGGLFLENDTSENFALTQGIIDSYSTTQKIAVFYQKNAFRFEVEGGTSFVADEYAVRVPRLDGLADPFIIPLSGDSYIDTNGSYARFKSGSNYLAVGNHADSPFLFWANAVNILAVRLAASNHTTVSNGSVTMKWLSGSNKLQVRNGNDTDYANLDLNHLAYKTQGTFSDRRLKENIKPYEEDPISLINSINLYTFNYIGDEGEQIGSIHDEAPDVIRVDGDPQIPETNAINVSNLTWLNTAALQHVIDVLKHNDLM